MRCMSPKGIVSFLDSESSGVEANLAGSSAAATVPPVPASRQRSAQSELSLALPREPHKRYIISLCWRTDAPALARGAIRVAVHSIGNLLEHGGDPASDQCGTPASAGTHGSRSPSHLWPACPTQPRGRALEAGKRRGEALAMEGVEHGAVSGAGRESILESTGDLPRTRRVGPWDDAMLVWSLTPCGPGLRFVDRGGSVVVRPRAHS